MTCEKVQKPTVGDIIHIRVRVSKVARDGVMVVPAHWEFMDGPAHLCDDENILKIEERQLAVGDKVTSTRNHGMTWTIKAIIGDEAWVEPTAIGPGAVCKLDILRRVA